VSTITLTLHLPPHDMPDADTDCIAFQAGEEEGQLAALIGEDDDGAPLWVGAAGERLGKVDAWCELPLRALARPQREHATITTRAGAQVDLAAPWRLPAC
jgi:hypothetical protein